MNFKGGRCIQFTDPRSGIKYALKAAKENQDWKLELEVEDGASFKRYFCTVNDYAQERITLSFYA